MPVCVFICPHKQTWLIGQAFPHPLWAFKKLLFNYTTENRGGEEEGI